MKNGHHNHSEHDHSKHSAHSSQGTRNHKKRLHMTNIGILNMRAIRLKVSRKGYEFH